MRAMQVGKNLGRSNVKHSKKNNYEVRIYGPKLKQLYPNFSALICEIISL